MAGVADGEALLSGPVLKNCSVAMGRGATYDITIGFDERYLGSDAVHVWDPTLANQDLMVAAAWMCVNASSMQPVTNTPLCQNAWNSRVAPPSPLEVQLNNSVWVPVSLITKNPPFAVNGTRKPGWNTATAQMPATLPTGESVVPTGLRYSWSNQPTCPGGNRAQQPCPPNSGLITTYNTTLPALPFNAMVTDGVCKCYAPQVCS